MTAHGKRYREAEGKVDREKEYAPGEAFKVLKSLPDAKFDETVEIAFNLGIDPRKADQMVRGTVSLPNGTGRSVRVAVFAVGDKAREATEAGADVVGGEDLVEEVIKGNIDSVNSLLYGETQTILADARRRLEIGRPDGGFILSTACSIAPHVAREKILLLREAVEKWG